MTVTRFRIYRNGKPTDITIETGSEHDAVLAALMAYGEPYLGPREELTAKPLPEVDETREQEAEEPSSEATQKEETSPICNYAHQFCQRKQKLCPHRGEIGRIKNGHAIPELARECRFRGEAISADEYNEYTRERVREMVRRWDHWLWWRT